MRHGFLLISIPLYVALVVVLELAGIKNFSGTWFAVIGIAMALDVASGVNGFRKGQQR